MGIGSCWPVDGPGSGISQESETSLSGMDGTWRWTGVDQHQDHSQYPLLRVGNADGAVHTPAGQGSHAAPLAARGRDVSCGASAASQFPYDTSVLSKRGGLTMGEFVTELWAFLKERKKFWLLPLITVLLLLSILIVLTQGSAVAPFIYTLF